ncbi:MAG: biopolymer transporter ExbD [Bdellovibrionaceae bacterium]|nr:biopolymer transporter ExbD [Pseudobdellovibrionaceae bacterium]MDW8189576.1 biopolymer transporter ExbD [Pseudobdellovibrionaceae bacterium]
MAIYPPGQKFRNYRLLSSRLGNRRSVVATLSLTAMVDMFTVLVIFLLQNYNVTGEVIFLPKEVVLPKAEKVKELAPAVSVTVSERYVFVDKEAVVPLNFVRSQQSWLIPSLKSAIERNMDVVRLREEAKLNNRIHEVMGGGRATRPSTIPHWKKVTVQADRMIEFATIKKILFTITEAGAQEINFAVLKEKR